MLYVALLTVETSSKQAMPLNGVCVTTLVRLIRAVRPVPSMDRSFVGNLVNVSEGSVVWSGPETGSLEAAREVDSHFIS